MVKKSVKITKNPHNPKTYMITTKGIFGQTLRYYADTKAEAKRIAEKLKG